MSYGDSANWDGTMPPAVKEIGETLRDQSESAGSFLAQILEFLSQLWHMIF